MKPTNFKYSNKTLQPPGDVLFSKTDVAGIDPLPVWTDGMQVVSCWKLSRRERLSALLFGRAWLAVLSGPTQPPALVVAQREYLKGPEDDGRGVRLIRSLMRRFGGREGCGGPGDLYTLGPLLLFEGEDGCWGLAIFHRQFAGTH
jgi:hypothetical protein